jgi:hypothetical protein
MATITPYIKSVYPTIEGNDRVYFDREFQKIQECLRAVMDALATYLEDVTIASGVITLPDVSNNLIELTVDTEAAGATDDLTTINGGRHGQILIIRAAANTRTVVVKDTTMRLAGDCTLDSDQDTITLINYLGTNWIELARSNNAA